MILYPTLTDWENETNSVNEGFTDSDGKTVFADLDKKVYYVDVWETTHDNYALKSEDIGFIRTSEIMQTRSTDSLHMLISLIMGKEKADATYQW